MSEWDDAAPRLPLIINGTHPTGGRGFGRKPGAWSSSAAAGKTRKELGSGNGAVVLRNDDSGWLKSVSTSGAFSIGCDHRRIWVLGCLVCFADITHVVSILVPCYAQFYVILIAFYLWLSLYLVRCFMVGQ